jgi:hypothetical protein
MKRGITMPPVAVERAGNNHSVDAVQVGHPIRWTFDDFASGLGRGVPDHVSQSSGAAALRTKDNQDVHHSAPSCADASASDLILVTVTRMMWPTNGRMNRQYRRKRRRDSGSVVTGRHS